MGVMPLKVFGEYLRCLTAEVRRSVVVGAGLAGVLPDRKARGGSGTTMDRKVGSNSWSRSAWHAGHFGADISFPGSRPNERHEPVALLQLLLLGGGPLGASRACR